MNRITNKSLAHAPVYLTALLLLAHPVAQACSVCQCGDYTISLMGTEKPYEGRLRLALDSSYRQESMGSPGDDQRVIHERRESLGASYAFSDRLTLGARLPFADKSFRDPDGSGEHGRGLGDLDLSARYVLSDATIPARQVYGLSGGLRLPTSQQRRQAGELLDVDAQPGAKATVPSLGGFYGWFRFPALVYISAQLSPTATGQQGFRQGAAAVATVTAQYALNPRVSLQLALENRYTGKNIDGGELDPDSGGFVTYLTPGIVARLTDELIVHASGQIKAVQHFNGHQTEDGEIRIGLTYDITRPGTNRTH